MDVLSGCMEESLVARLGAVPWWMPVENMWMGLETGESVLTPVNNTAILDSYNFVSFLGNPYSVATNFNSLGQDWQKPIKIVLSFYYLH